MQSDHCIFYYVTILIKNYEYKLISDMCNCVQYFSTVLVHCACGCGAAACVYGAAACGCGYYDKAFRVFVVCTM